MERLAHGISRVTAEAERWVNEDTLRIAITGLSRSGKTVFITSLISNLLALGRGRDTLPALTRQLAMQGRRIEAVWLEPAGAQALDWFDAAEKLRDLAGATPHWPPRTSDLASASLVLRVGRGGVLGRHLPPRRLRLEVLDYPGEWVLDLPMLDQSFSEWSEATLALLRQPPRAALATAFMAFLASLPTQAPAEDAVARRGHHLYRALLQAARERHGLRWLQPGRFLVPGPKGESPMMWFFPLPGSGPAAPGSLREALSRRFDAYREDMRRSYFDPWFARFDRQVVLVDALGALCAGEGAFADAQAAARHLARAYDARSRTRWLRRPMLKRVAFAASKADHVPDLQRPAFRALFRDMVGEGGAHVRHFAVASLRSTEEAPTTEAGPVVLGVPLGDVRRRPFRPGPIPERVPPPGDAFWRRPFFPLPEFRPPALDPDGREGLPQLGLDVLLSWLLEDAL
ncbi:YcjX family protein [Roseomonas sp. GC11]|uniref:YcjX family protein n=1 Tax=Roseomonas sp. GC11 TaxID=2950546 RepID=UPI00210916F2|nr:YcjX family protein [Roseomonas sp. GC11]MCQ4162926.1 YcjX family protein [Roseomonas sp. GC11]